MLHQVVLIALFCVQTLASPGCGVPRIKHQALIVRGSPTQPGEWPWHAGVYHRSGRNSQYACGGTLISSEFVVTAAHCMLDEGTSYRLTRKRIFVRLGVHNLDRIDPGAMQQFTIADIHMFGNFTRDNLHNDIALLELAFTNVAKYLDWMGNITGMDFTDRPAALVTTTEAPKKRERVPYSPRVSDKKCYEYLRYRKANYYDFYTVKIWDNGPQTCLANIISERFLLSSGYCAYGRFDQISIKAEFYNGQYDFQFDGLKMVLHPNHTGTDYVSASAVVLIDLGRNYDELKPDVGCLWTDPNEITLESVSGAIWPTEMPTGPPLNVSESADGRFLRTNDNISCDNDRSILGVRLGLRKKGESFFRIVGPLVDCESSEYARLTPEYLDWIESVVWPGETVNSIRNQIVNLARKPFSG